MNRPGVILVLVLIAVIALELLAMSAFGFARIAQLGARMAGRDAALQSAADDAAEQVAAGIDRRAVLARPAGSAWNAAVAAPSGTLVSTELRRLHNGYVLTTATARYAGNGSARRASALVRIIEPAAILAAFPAVLTAFGFASESVSGSAPPDPGPGPAPGPVSPTATSPPPGGCAGEPGEAALAPPDLPLFAHRTYADSLPFGAAVGANWPVVMRIADARAMPLDTVTATVQPALIALEGAMTLDHPTAGAIAVDGDLVMAAGARVRGLLTVHGTLTLEGGAEIHGAARATAVVDEGGQLVYDRCAIEFALDAPALLRVYRHGRWRVPAFD